MRRGPRPARPPAGRPLSPSRAALLEALEAQPEPTGVPALAAMTGLHVNTLREHLDALLDAGLVRRHRAAPAGRGRPGWLYEATGRSPEQPQPESASLAAALAGVIARTSPHPVEDARAAGVEWGGRLAHAAGTPARPGAAAARRKVVEIFDRMGFAPETDRAAHRVRLTRCPLLEAAYQQPDVVCAVHLGVAQGALAEYGADAADGELRPFAEPGACLLYLRAGGPAEATQ